MGILSARVRVNSSEGVFEHGPAEAMSDRHQAGEMAARVEIFVERLQNFNQQSRAAN
jgi:hypothetical protein